MLQSPTQYIADHSAMCEGGKVTRRSVLHYSADQTFHIERQAGFYPRILP